MRVHLEERVAIAAPPEAVFAAVADWEGQSDWVALTTVTADGGPHRVGERLVAETRVGGVGFSDPMEVTRFDPPHRIDVRHLGRVVRGTGTFLVEPAPGGAWFVWVEDVDLPLGVVGRARLRGRRARVPAAAPAQPAPPGPPGRVPPAPAQAPG